MKKQSMKDDALNLRDDKAILSFQAALRATGIDLDHPCAGTLIGFAEVGRYLCKAECLAQGNRSGIRIYRTDRLRESLESAKTRVESANRSDYCVENGQPWMHLAFTKPDRYDQSYELVSAVMTVAPPETFSEEYFSQRIAKVLAFAKENWA